MPSIVSAPSSPTSPSLATGPHLPRQSNRHHPTLAAASAARDGHRIGSGYGSDSALISSDESQSVAIDALEAADCKLGGGINKKDKKGSRSSGNPKALHSATVTSAGGAVKSKGKPGGSQGASKAAASYSDSESTGLLTGSTLRNRFPKALGITSNAF
jgi:hypothetical protein